MDFVHFRMVMEILGMIKNATAGSEGGTARVQEPAIAGMGRPGECLEAVGSNPKAGNVWDSPQVSPFSWSLIGQKTLEINCFVKIGNKDRKGQNKTDIVGGVPLADKNLSAGDTTLTKYRRTSTKIMCVTCDKDFVAVYTMILTNTNRKLLRKILSKILVQLYEKSIWVDCYKDFVANYLARMKLFKYKTEPISTYSQKPVFLQVTSDEESFCSTTTIYSPGLEEECFPDLWEAQALEKRKVAFKTPSPVKTQPEPSKRPGFGLGGAQTSGGSGNPPKKSGPTRGGGSNPSRGGGAGTSRGGGNSGNNAGNAGSGASGGGGGKRNADGDARKPKKTFAEMTKDLKVIEVRASDPRYPLKQDDFDCLEFTMLHKYLDLDVPNFVYSTPRPGLSQGAVWYGCANEGTYNFIKETAPEVDPPEEKPYRYIIAAGNKRYIKIRCPKKFWMSRERLLKAILLQNPSLARVQDEEGIWKEAHLVITSGLEEENKEKAIADGFFMLGIEIEDVSIDAFVKKRGEIMVGNSTLRVTGAGIDARIEEADRIEADRVRAEEIAAQGPSFNF